MNKHYKTPENQIASSSYSWVVVVFTISSRDHGQPYDKSTWNERQDAGHDFKTPREMQMIVIRRASANPEIFALKFECVVGKHHRSRHQEHTCW